ncbi:MAG: cupin-like domain-containing protein [Sphingomonadales bacterium]|nr:cupin-like domain-containing protein [Sphingomonadales bacterium]
MTAFPPDSKAAFSALYPETPGPLTHGLADHPLLTLEALVHLAHALPASSVEYNPALIPIGIAPEDTPKSNLSIEETIRSIEENGSWMVLKRIEQHPDYARLLKDALAELEDVTRTKTGAMLGQEGFIFISSPHAVTPFHFDPEHNILLQIRGEKTMTVFPKDDERIVDPRAHEDFHLGRHHRNLEWRDEFADVRTDFRLLPGDAVHMPVKIPHWVKVGSAVSISLSITWRSEWSYREADARALNSLLRRAGLKPSAPGNWPHQNAGKATAWRVLRKAGLARGD